MGNTSSGLLVQEWVWHFCLRCVCSLLSLSWAELAVASGCACLWETTTTNNKQLVVVPLWINMSSADEVTASKEEEDLLNAALFATECVEGAGLSFDRYTESEKKQKKKKKKKIEKMAQEPQKPTAAHVSATCRERYSTRSKDRLMTVATYKNKRRRSLWNADAELSLWNTLANLIKQFETHLWVLVPLHPSVLHEDSIRFALLGQPSERVEDFPLLFNVNVAMACGTHTKPLTKWFTTLCSLYVWFVGVE